MKKFCIISNILKSFTTYDDHSKCLKKQFISDYIAVKLKTNKLKTGQINFKMP